jgi:hypothetical protein
MKSAKPLHRLGLLIANALPVLMMIALVPVIKDDFLLAIVFVVVIAVALLVHYERNDLLVLITGGVLMFIAEWLFLLTGVETFARQSLLAMPLWLPVLWAYGWVTIKRILRILELHA